MPRGVAVSRTSRKLWRTYLNLWRGTFPSDKDRTWLTESARRDQPDEEAEWLLRTLGLLGDPVLAPLIEPYLQRTDAPELANEALWALCRCGLQATYKDYILHAVNPGFDWDQDWEVRTSALYGAGEYLRNHKDPDFARMIAELVDRDHEPPWRSLDDRSKANTAEMAAAFAMGGDPETLAMRDDDDVLRKALVVRFLAERRNG